MLLFLFCAFTHYFLLFCAIFCYFVLSHAILLLLSLAILCYQKPSCISRYLMLSNGVSCYFFLFCINTTYLLYILLYPAFSCYFVLSCTISHYHVLLQSSAEDGSPTSVSVELRLALLSLSWLIGSLYLIFLLISLFLFPWTFHMLFKVKMSNFVELFVLFKYQNDLNLMKL